MLGSRWCVLSPCSFLTCITHARFCAIADPLLRQAPADELTARSVDILHEHAFSSLIDPRAGLVTLLRDFATTRDESCGLTVL